MEEGVQKGFPYFKMAETRSCWLQILEKDTGVGEAEKTEKKAVDNYKP